MTEADLPAQGDERFEILMMGYLDGELDSRQEAELREHLNSHPEAIHELDRYRKLMDLAGSVRLKEPQDYEWDRFWADLYNRMERKAGWILCLLGILLTTGAASWWMWQSAALPTWLKVGVTTLCVGALILFLSVLRGRLRTLPFDRFRGVHR